MKRIKQGAVIASGCVYFERSSQGRPPWVTEGASHAEIQRQFQAEGTVSAKVLRKILLGVLVVIEL